MTATTSAPVIPAKIIGIITFTVFSITSIFFISYISVNEMKEYPPSLTIAVAASNDIHGYVYPTLLSRKDTG